MTRSTLISSRRCETQPFANTDCCSVSRFRICSWPFMTLTTSSYTLTNIKKTWSASTFPRWNKDNATLNLGHILSAFKMVTKRSSRQESARTGSGCGVPCLLSESVLCWKDEHVGSATVDGCQLHSASQRLQQGFYVWIVSE